MAMAFMSPMTRDQRARVVAYLQSENYDLLDRLARAQQDLFVARELASRQMSRPPYSMMEWYRYPEGYDAFQRMKAEGSFTDQKYRESFDRYWDTEIQRREARVRNKYPMSHCVGAVLARLLRHCAVPVRGEIKREQEEYQQRTERREE